MVYILKFPKKKNKIDNFQEFEIPDFQNVVVRLTKEHWKHILVRRGQVFHNYWDNIKETIEKPDYIGRSKTHESDKIYIQENNSERSFFSKYLIVIVDGNNDIVTAWIGNKIDKFNDIKRIKK